MAVVVIANFITVTFIIVIVIFHCYQYHYYYHLIDNDYVETGTYKTQELPCHYGPCHHMFKVYSR